MQTALRPETACYHCGDSNAENFILKHGKSFCCNGCLMVYEILDNSSLTHYYDIETTPGKKEIDAEIGLKYAYLDLPEIKDQLLSFSEGNLERITFTIPSIHCSSCIWLLENLHELNENILSSTVNFPKKEATINFNSKNISLREVAELLHKIGYKVNLKLDNLNKKQTASSSKSLIIKLGIAGFCFGNIMLFSFPEYLSNGELDGLEYKSIFNYLNVLLSLPVLLYAASDYFISSYRGLKGRFFNIDVPISIGILVLFTRSIYEVFTHTGAGYFDSMSGLVFFLLIGKWFQEKAYHSISFEKDYQSYFPIAITRLNQDSSEEVVPLNKINIGDTLYIHSGEIIPCDAQLLGKTAVIDYSFVTGESKEVVKHSGDKLYAGGKSINNGFEIKALKNISQSYLVELWNQENYNKPQQSKQVELINLVSKYFSIVILMIAFFSGITWWIYDASKVWQVISAVLIVACPCALALSAPFTFGYVMRQFGKKGFFIKNSKSIEQLSACNHIIFDKTGTISISNELDLKYHGDQLNEIDKNVISSICKKSTHPLSRAIFNKLTGNMLLEIEHFEEIVGKGLTGRYAGNKYKIGSGDWLEVDTTQDSNQSVFIFKNKEKLGSYEVHNKFRNGINKSINGLATNKLSLLSGDGDSEKAFLKNIFPKNTTLLFKQSPFDKLNFIKEHQNKGDVVLMIGDGLNDSGAFKQSDFGIAISEDINHFSPSCDGILNANSFQLLPFFKSYSNTTMRIIRYCIFISILYNVVGLGLAVTGNISPITAAILMPLSSISVVAFIMASVKLSFKLSK